MTFDRLLSVAAAHGAAAARGWNRRGYRVRLADLDEPQWFPSAAAAAEYIRANCSPCAHGEDHGEDQGTAGAGKGGLMRAGGVRHLARRVSGAGVGFVVGRSGRRVVVRRDEEYAPSRTLTFNTWAEAAAYLREQEEE